MYMYIQSNLQTLHYFQIQESDFLIVLLTSENILNILVDSVITVSIVRTEVSMKCGM